MSTRRLAITDAERDIESFESEEVQYYQNSHVRLDAERCVNPGCSNWAEMDNERCRAHSEDYYLPYWLGSRSYSKVFSRESMLEVTSD